MIRDLPGLALWRLDTQGWYAARELAGAVEILTMAAGRGLMIPARLLLALETEGESLLTMHRALSRRIGVGR